MSDGSVEIENPSETEKLSPQETLRKDLTNYQLELGRRFGIPEVKLNEYAEEAVNKALAEAEKVSRFDSKYQILNSEGLKYELAIAVETARRYNLPLTAAFIDLEGMGEINSKLGQEGGDGAIRVAVGAINSNIRKSDIPGRVPAPEDIKVNGGKYEAQVAAREGGDEFVVLFLGTPLEGGVVASQRILESVSRDSDSKMPKYREAFGKSLGARAGVAQFNPTLDQDGTGFLRRIGGAMYMTKKRAGKIGVSAPIYRDNDYQTVIVKNFKTPKAA